jgi:hypothetical protein
MYGISSEMYRNTNERPLYGPGKSSTIRPLLWLLCFTLIYLSLRTSVPNITIRATNNNELVQYVGEAFVDDSGLGTNTKHDNYQHLISDLQTLVQRWEKLLFSTGGALNLTKCFLVLTILEVGKWYTNPAHH